MTPIRAKIDHNHFQVEKVNLIIQSFVKSRETLKLYLDSDEQLFAIVTKGSHGDVHFNFSNHKNLVPRKFNMILKQSTFFSPSFSSVTILHLRSVSDVVRNMVTDLFSSFRVLESLKIEKCDGLEDIEIRGNECLKNFEMVDCSDIVRVVLSARNLESFSYRGVFAIIQLMDVLNLVDFRLDLRDGLGDNNNAFDCEDVLSLLCSVKDVEVLRVSSWLLEIDQTLSPVEYPLINQYWHEPHLWKDYATVKSNACGLKNLKTIKIIGFTKEKNELLLMDILLHSAINLKEMNIFASKQDDYYSWRVARIPFSQLKYIKFKYVLISCPDIDSCFVLIEA
ncbi:hypothetical protein DH2020_017860 [Rehmannia glutinosa]|uniref:FBD domain-containing protein n=1 Tax=Rehmannia glutinosa TaxID=99300 RepID=A0ABR0WH65_REHGL